MSEKVEFEGVVAPTDSRQEDTPASKMPDAPNNSAKTGIRRSTFCCLAAAWMVEGADSQLLNTCLFALQRDIGLSLHEIAVLTTAQMIMANLACPFWGILADRHVLKKRSILALGCLGVGVAVTGMSLVSTILPLVFLRAMCGVFLATLRPVSVALVAELTPEEHRGRAFGQLHSSYMLGMLVVTLVGGNVSNLYFMGIAGWRVLFGISGFITYGVALMLVGCMTDPDRPLEKPASDRALKIVRDEICAVLRFLTIPSFSILVLQGIFGGIPWSILGNNLLYFKLCGLEDWQGSLLTAELTAVGMLGAPIGGSIADFLARKLGYHGRPLSAQITVFTGIPLMYMQFYGLPPGQGTFWEYFAITAAFGLLGMWAGVGTNLPILSDIVPAEHRCKVMAWEGALESSTAAAVGPVAVSFLAQDLFGYTFGEDMGDPLESASALGKAMAATICIPWTVTFLAYGLLHWSYPRDMRLLRK
mmetsp:Transcript_41342/g.76948  ORF Transcript_41342/g.76948 Transcript_41342/m.76948 type:complete len:475 (-) Transcript_41342:388-1812(-)